MVWIDIGAAAPVQIAVRFDKVPYLGIVRDELIDGKDAQSPRKRHQNKGEDLSTCPVTKPALRSAKNSTA